MKYKFKEIETQLCELDKCEEWFDLWRGTVTKILQKLLDDFAIEQLDESKVSSLSSPNRSTLT